MGGGLFDDQAIDRAATMAIRMADVPQDHTHVVVRFNGLSTGGLILVVVRAGQHWLIADRIPHSWSGGILGEACVIGSWGP